MENTLPVVGQAMISAGARMYRAGTDIKPLDLISVRLCAGNEPLCQEERGTVFVRAASDDYNLHTITSCFLRCRKDVLLLL